MRHFRFFRFLWLVLVTVLLQTSVILAPQASLSPQPSTPTRALVHSRSGASSSCGEAGASVSKELGLQCERQNKQGFALGRAITLSSAGVQQRGDHLRAAAQTPALVSIRFFLSRKFSPPTADDDPFLS